MTLPNFGGGYKVEFKLLPKAETELISRNIEQARRIAEVVGNDQKRTFKIDISKFEFCGRKSQIEIDDYTINIYTPEMIVIEKLRALCQQMKEYKYYRKGKAPRTRDIYDIYVLVKNLNVSLDNEADLINDVFKAKEVPVELLGKIPDNKDHYLKGLQQLSDTIENGLTEQQFDECFNLVVNLTNTVLTANAAL